MWGGVVVAVLVRPGVLALRAHGQFFFQVRFEVLETCRNDPRFGEELTLLRVHFRQIDLRAAIAKPRDAARRGGVVLETVESSPLPWVRSKQLHKGARFF